MRGRGRGEAMEESNTPRQRGREMRLAIKRTTEDASRESVPSSVGRAEEPAGRVLLSSADMVEAGGGSGCRRKGMSG